MLRDMSRDRTGVGVSVGPKTVAGAATGAVLSLDRKPRGRQCAGCALVDRATRRNTAPERPRGIRRSGLGVSDDGVLRRRPPHRGARAAFSDDRWRPRARGARTGRRYGLADRRARRDVDAPHRRSFVRWPKVLDRYHNHLAGHLSNRRDAMQRGVIRVRVGRRCRADVLDVRCVHANRERITPQFALVHHAMRDRCRRRGKRGNAGKKRKHESRRAERTHQAQTYVVVARRASAAPVAPQPRSVISARLPSKRASASLPRTRNCIVSACTLNLTEADILVCMMVWLS